MTESDFIRYVAKRANYSIPIVKDLLFTMKECFTELLEVGEQINFPNVGKFDVIHREGHIARDMKTMKDMYIAPHYHVKFIQSPKFKERVERERE